MANLVPCKECKQEISKKAKTCPSCGVSQPGVKGVSTTAGCLIIGLALFMFTGMCGVCAGGGSSSSSTYTQPNTPSTPSRPSAPPKPRKGGKWQASTGASGMSDKSDLYLSLEGDSAIKGWLSSETPSLILRCKENKTEVYIRTDIQANPELGKFQKASVRLRFDSKKPVRQTWSESTDNKALFASRKISLIKKMLKHDNMLFEFTPFNSSPGQSNFQLKGLKDVIGPLRKACGW